MRVNLMIEGQESVTWQQWLGLAGAVEDAGLEGLFRSDHYQSVQGRTERSSLDAWTTIAALATTTSTIRLGTMVSPTSFRHPSVLCKDVVTADHVSGGRVELGIGAGWHDLEHTDLRVPVRVGRDADGRLRGAARDRRPADDRGALRLPRRALHPRRLRGAAEAGPVAAGADHHRRIGQATVGAPRCHLGRRVQHHVPLTRGGARPEGGRRRRVRRPRSAAAGVLDDDRLPHRRRRGGCPRSARPG